MEVSCKSVHMADQLHLMYTSLKVCPENKLHLAVVTIITTLNVKSYKQLRFSYDS